MILYSHPLYDRLSPWLSMFERKGTHREDVQARNTEEGGITIALFGLGQFGSGIARELRQHGHRVIGVDFDPELVRQREDADYSVHYGDAEDPEFLATLPLGQLSWIVISVREVPVNLTLLHGLRDHGLIVEFQ